MALDIFDRQLRLILLLTEGRGHTLYAIADMLGVSKRTLYRYLEEFRNFGIETTIQDGIVKLDKNCTYFQQLTERIQFTEQEAIALKRVLEGIRNKTAVVKHLLHKLSRIYDLKLLEEIASDENFAKNQALLYQAAKEGWQVELKDYSSSHSQTISNRLVEPYSFIANNTEVRCFEIDSKTNKSYKITRIGQVILLPTPWEYRHLHKQVYTDTFHFSGENLTQVRLRLNLVATNLLKEEFVIRPNELVQEDDKHWIYTTDVCSYIGIGRFVMGLLNSIEILEGEGLKHYIQQEIQKYTQ